MTPNPAKDGIDHINIYSKGKTELGRLLTNLAPTPFYLDGIYFKSAENFWFYVKAINCSQPQEVIDRILKESPFGAKNYWQTLGVDVPDPDKDHLKAAYLSKLEHNPRIKELLLQNSLRLEHYYVYGTKVVQPIKHQWTADLWQEVKSDFVEVAPAKHLNKST